jgi:hypothetical protein
MPSASFKAQTFIREVRLFIMNTNQMNDMRLE